MPVKFTSSSLDEVLENDAHYDGNGRLICVESSDPQAMDLSTGE